MNIRINTICFILLLFLLIGVASAADIDNETLKESIESEEPLEISSENDEKLEASSTNEDILKASSKEKVTIEAPSIKMHYNDGSRFTVTLKDSKKNVVKNAKVKIKINGKIYTKTTNSKGKALLKINLESGKYTVKTYFYGTSEYKSASVKSTVTIKSTIKCSDYSKYYKKNSYYSSKFYDKNGGLLKQKIVKFKLNGKTFRVKTDSRGIARMNIDLKPGKYSITSINSKTSETITKTITIKTILQTHDLTMNESDGSKFSVKVLDSNGKVSPNKIVTLNVNGQIYTPASDSNGIASQTIDLPEGTYSISTEYAGLKHINQITVNKGPEKVKQSEFTHSIIIPDYINVTIPYAFDNSQYTIKAGANGTVKMPKIEVYTITVGEKSLQFSTGTKEIDNAMKLDQNTYLIDFNGNLVSCVNKNSLKGTGILISKISEAIEIDYRDITSNSTELFGFYADKSTDNSETFTYLKNDKVTAKISVQTRYYDETGVKYNLKKLYNRVNLDFPYYEITNHVKNPVVFTNTGKSVTYSYYTNYIAGYPTREDIITKFTINGREELEKTEQISYGRADKYRNTLGFEVLQTYSIINEKMTKSILESWINKNSAYLSRFGVMNIYGMHLASLETAWLADEIADSYAKEFNVDWSRRNTATILGGINLEDTYLHILNADMGMKVYGDKQNAELFRLINSLNLPNIESYVLEPIEDRFMNTTENSLDNVLNSMSKNNYSIAQLGEMMYIFGENNSAIILNTTSGVSHVILSNNNSVYKGSKIHTSEDCCCVGIMPKDIIRGIRELFKILAPSTYLLSNHFNDIHPFSKLTWIGVKFLMGKVLTGAAASVYGIASIGLILQQGGSAYKDSILNEKDWHTAMDTVTFTRPGYLQSKKVYNIPNKNGGYDYIEVNINDDLTLDRNNAKYISQGSTKQLSKEETYQYFTEDYWLPINVPAKYWDKSWKAS